MRALPDSGAVVWSTERLAGWDGDRSDVMKKHLRHICTRHRGHDMRTNARLRLAVSVGFALIIGLVVSFGTGVEAQPGEVDWSAVSLSTHHVAGTVHYLEGRGGKHRAFGW